MGLGDLKDFGAEVLDQNPKSYLKDSHKKLIAKMFASQIKLQALNGKNFIHQVKQSRKYLSILTELGLDDTSTYFAFLAKVSQDSQANHTAFYLQEGLETVATVQDRANRSASLKGRNPT